MIRNFIKVALRNLLKQKLYSAINITGLTLGISCFLVIFFFVKDELSYDRFHKNADQIYRVISKGLFKGKKFDAATMGAPVASRMVTDYPEVLSAVRLYPSSLLIRLEDQNIRENNIIYADSNFFNFFTFPLIKGNPDEVLKDPQSLVLTRKTAKKYFGTEDVVGKSLIINDNEKEPWKITGLCKEPPYNSHFHFDVLASMSSREDSYYPIWTMQNFHTYLLLDENASVDQLESKFVNLVEKYVFPEVEKFMGASIEDFVDNNTYYGFFLQPLSDIHLHSNLLGELEGNSDIKYVYIFSFIAVFILLLACINFINLSTARSTKRAREVGVRKVVGSTRGLLVRQFLFESVIFSLIALIISIGLVELLLPNFNYLLNRELHTTYFTDVYLIPLLLAGAVFIGFLAGIYPAFLLSGYKPVKVLKGLVTSGYQKKLFRSGLVIFQFGISIILVIGTLVAYQQINFIQNKKLGFNKDNILVLHNAYSLGDHMQSFREEVLNYPEVINSSISSYYPLSPGKNTSTINPEGNPTNTQPTTIYQTDYHFCKTLGIDIIKGRGFDPDRESDKNTMLVNETVVDLFDLESPIGTKMILPNPRNPEQSGKYEIIGVVENFHYESLRNLITPLIIIPRQHGGNIVIHFQSKDYQQLLTKIESKWQEVVPMAPFEYSFLDNQFENAHKAEQKTGKLFTVFAGLAIIIAALGLFGLTTYSTEQRTKEIGVRKVMGASFKDIIKLISREFLLLIAISFVIAAPVGFYLMSEWLQEFPYKTQITPLVFLIAGLLIILVCFFTISYHSVKSARINPVKSLRYE